MLKAVAFDLWETLITDLPEIARKQESARLSGIERALVSGGVPVTLERVAEAHRAAWHRCWDLYWSRDLDVSARGQIVHFLESLGLDPARIDEPLVAEVERIYGGAALEHLPELVAGASSLIDEVKSLGLAIGVISNTGRTPGSVLRQILDARGLGQRIDAMVFSNEHGECKPRRSIFEALREKLGCEFEEIAFVGDNLYADVHGAQSCGMKAIHFVPPSRGMAVGQATREEFELDPYPSADTLTAVGAIIRELAQ